MLVNKQARLIEKTIKRNKFYSNLLRQARIKKTWDPDITISRDPGSGGRLVAKKVAKKLGWKYYDKLIFKEIAKELKISEHIVKALDESPKSNWVTNFILSFFNQKYISEYEYVKTLKKIIIKTGQKEDVVFLGRGSYHIIPRNRALHVRITAPLETRIQNTHKYENKTIEQARKQVNETERKRKLFLKQYFNCDHNNPDNFDLIVNTDDISLDCAADIIIESFKRKFYRKKVSVKN